MFGACLDIGTRLCHRGFKSNAIFQLPGVGAPDPAQGHRLISKACTDLKEDLSDPQTIPVAVWPRQSSFCDLRRTHGPLGPGTLLLPSC